MSGRGNNNRGGGRGGRGGNGGGRGRGTGPKPKIASGSNKKGAKEELGEHVFTYGTRDAADKMRQSWEYIITYVGNAYSGNMMTKLHDRKRCILTPLPPHSKAIKDAHNKAVKKYKARIDRELQNNRDGLAVLMASPDQSASTTMSIIATKNTIGALEEAYNETPKIVLSGEDLEQRQAEHKDFDKANSCLKEHRPQVFALILGQVIPILLGQLKYKAAYPGIYSRKDPLELYYDLIEKTVQQKTEDSYVYAVAISELQHFLALCQQHATPEAYYDSFNGRTDVSKNIGMSLGHHPLLLNYVAKELSIILFIGANLEFLDAIFFV
jgi:hypothetical protein